jgi:hypothetical protein
MINGHGSAILEMHFDCWLPPSARCRGSHGLDKIQKIIPIDVVINGHGTAVPSWKYILTVGCLPVLPRRWLSSQASKLAFNCAAVSKPPQITHCNIYKSLSETVYVGLHVTDL